MSNEKKERENKRVQLTEEFALDVLLGFSHKEKYLSSKYFYDQKGSELFTKIMDVEEYYPTDCEYEILNAHKADADCPARR